MKLRLIKHAGAVLAVAIALVGAQTTPAGATTAGAGVVTGEVSIDPGVSLTPSTQDFEFTGTIITGAVVVDGVPWAGTVEVDTVTGGPPTPEDTISGGGTINPFTAEGTLEIPDVQTKVLTVEASGGAYIRVGGVVLVEIEAEVTITCTGLVDDVVTDSGRIDIVALFAPLVGDGVTTPVTSAAFAGPWVASDLLPNIL